MKHFKQKQKSRYKLKGAEGIRACKLPLTLPKEVRSFKLETLCSRRKKAAHTVRTKESNENFAPGKKTLLPWVASQVPAGGS